MGGISGAGTAAGRAYVSGAERDTRLSRQRRSTVSSCFTSTAAVYTSVSPSRASMARRSTAQDTMSSAGRRSILAHLTGSSASLSPGRSLI